MSLSALPPTTNKRLALISGRTADNPKLLTESIQVRSTRILKINVILLLSNYERMTILKN